MEGGGGGVLPSLEWSACVCVCMCVYVCVFACACACVCVSIHGLNSCSVVSGGGGPSLCENSVWSLVPSRQPLETQTMG